jgi:feruloyl-CoA synthase
VVITGHDRDEVGLLIFPRLDSCRKLAGLAQDAPARAVVESPSVREFFVRMLQQLHAQGTGSASRVARALILTEPPSIDVGEVTDKGSINQRVVLAYRASDVERLYGDNDEVLLALTGP